VDYCLIAYDIYKSLNCYLGIRYFFFREHIVEISLNNEVEMRLFPEVRYRAIS
jgi:hypothetical protein